MRLHHRRLVSSYLHPNEDDTTPDLLVTLRVCMHAYLGPIWIQGAEAHESGSLALYLYTRHGTRGAIKSRLRRREQRYKVAKPSAPQTTPFLPQLAPRHHQHRHAHHHNHPTTPCTALPHRLPPCLLHPRHAVRAGLFEGRDIFLSRRVSTRSLLWLTSGSSRQQQAEGTQGTSG